ncbi:MAG: sigma-54 factor interaction domain-containing protein [Vicinamibacterales bacterium]
MDSVVVGRSARMRAVFEFLRVIGNSDSTVLVTGESGTGKEVTATLIHQNSRRRHHPFVAVSCALFSETLIESELFGHERGAFTGAIKDCPGRFELAEGGTIFLDDIDDVPLSMQVKLLRVLQNRTIERLGGTRTVPVNVRVIAGSKRDLEAARLRREVPRRPLLPSERPASDAAAAARAARGRAGADGAFPQPLLQTAQRRDACDLRCREAGVHALLVAGQRPRARERLRARRTDLLLRDGPYRLHVREHPVPCRRAAGGAHAAGHSGVRHDGPDLARRLPARGRGKPDWVGAEGQRWQQVARGRALANQTVHARRPHQPMWSRRTRET